MNRAIGTVVRIDNPMRRTFGYQVRWKGKPSKLFSVSTHGSWDAAHLAALQAANLTASLEIRAILEEVASRAAAGKEVPITTYVERIEKLTAHRRRGLHRQQERLDAEA